MVRELTCIRCPIGCQLTVAVEENGAVSVSGNSCPRGAQYGAAEVTNPTRIVTSSVRVDGGELPLVCVKTASDIPKAKIFDVMHVINHAKAEAPIKIGDVLVENVAGTGVNVIATANIE